MTFSIIVRSENGSFGIGVATHQLCVGAGVPWVKAGVGAVAVQGTSSLTVAWEALKLMENGSTAEEAFLKLTSAEYDPKRETRQTAIIGTAGPPCVFTGSQGMSFCGHLIEQNFSVQCNICEGDVLTPMRDAFIATSKDDPLAERILCALEAGDKAGGDMRGKLSAAILVRGEIGISEELDRSFWDLRVDCDPNPIGVLRRIVEERKAQMKLYIPMPEKESTPMSIRERMEMASSSVSDEDVFWFCLTKATEDETQAQEALEVTLEKNIFDSAKPWMQVLKRHVVVEPRAVPFLRMVEDAMQ